MDAIGVPYQLGMTGLCAASDLAEGLLNNPDRPPVYHMKTGKEIRPGKAIPHFNEVDEGCGVDAIITNKLWSKLGIDPSLTLHDVRYGANFGNDFVWVFMISGAVPASHIKGGYSNSYCYRQPPMYFAKGGGTLSGEGKPGEIVWSRIYLDNKKMYMDIGRAKGVELPEEEVKRRWEITTPQWPQLNCILEGVSRDQFMAKHKSNHILIAYAPDAKKAEEAMWAKAALAHSLGLNVNICRKN